MARIRYVWWCENCLNEVEVPFDEINAPHCVNCRDIGNRVPMTYRGVRKL